MGLIVIWLLIILLFSATPIQGIQAGNSGDKIIHFLIYGITAILFIKFFRKGMSLMKSTILSVTLASFYGLFIELLQHALPWREFSLLDEVSNFTGATIFSVIYAFREHSRKNSDVNIKSIYRKTD